MDFVRGGKRKFVCLFFANAVKMAKQNPKKYIFGYWF